jgi:hypothetical protein
MLWVGLYLLALLAAIWLVGALSRFCGDDEA